MDVRMKAQLLAPCMQHTDDARSSSKMFFIFCKSEQCCRRCIKKQFIQKLSMPHDYTVQLMRQCKYNMIIFYRKQFLHPCFYPFLFFYRSAIRAMPVSAAMILVLYMPATIFRTPVHVIAKR